MTKDDKCESQHGGLIPNVGFFKKTNLYPMEKILEHVIYETTNLNNERQSELSITSSSLLAFDYYMIKKLFLSNAITLMQLLVIGLITFVQHKVLFFLRYIRRWR